MEKLYDRIIFVNGTAPALNDANLNAMSKAIDDIDDRVLLLGTDVLTVIPQIQAYLEQAETIEEALEQLSQNPPYIGANGHWYTFDTSTEQYVDSGVDASISVQIADITMLSEGATPYVTNTGTDTDPVFHLFIPVGATGNGIASISKTGTSGNVDTYTITMTNGNTATFTVTNATSGSVATLTDVTLNNPATGQTLIYNSTTQKWENASIPAPSVALNDLTDVTITSASNGQVLTKTSNGWENKTLATYVDGTITSGNTSVTISDASITTNSLIDIYWEDAVITPASVSVATGSVTITLDTAASSNQNVKIKVTNV